MIEMIEISSIQIFVQATNPRISRKIQKYGSPKVTRKTHKRRNPKRKEKKILSIT